MKKPHIIYSGQWKKEFWLCYWWTAQEFEEYLLKIKDPDPKVPISVSWQTVKTESWWILIWVNKLDAKTMLLVLNHEILHAVFYTMRDKWVDYCFESEETFTYTNEWLQNECYWYIKLEIKEITV